MKILVACEESQAVTIEFRKLGCEAYSCDILPPSGGHPEWHIKDDVLPLLNGRVVFSTVDGTRRSCVMWSKWDMIIAFPPCTDLAVSGAAWFEQKRKDGRQQQGIDFFMEFVNVDCERVAIENPVGIMSTQYRKADQIIQPWMFGDNVRKTTCLWLKGLQPLYPEATAEPPLEYFEWTDKHGKKKRQPLWFYQCSHTKGKSGIQRSKTFPGIARAMAEQWSEQISINALNPDGATSRFSPDNCKKL